MSTCAQVIQSAYRIAHVRARAASIVPGEKEVGLERLGGMFRAMLTNGLFGPLTDKYLTSADAYEACEYERVINTAAATITMPATVTDAFSGEDRTPRDLAVIAVVDPNADDDDALTLNIYDAWRANWFDIGTLSFDGYCPLSHRFDEHLKNLLAVHICDEAGLPISPLLARNAASARMNIASNHGAPRAPVQHEFF